MIDFGGLLNGLYSIVDDLAYLLFNTLSPVIAGFLLAKAYKFVFRWRLRFMFRVFRYKVPRVSIILPVWEGYVREGSGRVMLKNSGVYGTDEVDYIGNPDMLARQDVVAMSVIQDRLIRRSGVPSDVQFDNDTLRYDNPTIIIGSPTANDACKYLMSCVGPEQGEKFSPIHLENLNRRDPNGLVIHSIVSGKTYKSTKESEVAVIFRTRTPFDTKHGARNIVICGQFANGTKVAADYFSRNWWNIFFIAQDEVIIDMPTGQSGPIRILEKLRWGR